MNIGLARGFYDTGRTWLAVGLLCSLTLASILTSVGRAADRSVASTLIAGLRNHVEHLRSGVVKFQVRDEAGRVVAKHFVAFDQSGGRVRSDVEQANLHRSVRVIRTNREFLQFLQIGKNDSKLLRLNPGATTELDAGMPIDVRGVGFGGYPILIKGGKVENVLKNMEIATPVDVVFEKDIAVLVLEAEHSTAWATHMVFWVDTAHDYVPVKNEVRIVSPDGHFEVRQQLETSWVQIKDTWVPSQSRFRYERGGGEPPAVSDMRLTWRSVNEEVPNELFSEKGLTLPNGTYVIDKRLGTPIVERVIGLNRPLPAAPVPRQPSQTRAAIVIACTVLLLLLAMILALRQRRRRTQHP